MTSADVLLTCFIGGVVNVLDFDPGDVGVDELRFDLHLPTPHILSHVNFYKQKVVVLYSYCSELCSSFKRQ